MNRKGIEFCIESEKSINYEEFSNNKELIKELQKLCKTVDSLEIGFTDEDILKCCGKIVSYTKKECEAKYTILKEEYKRILEKYYKKIKLIDRMKLYFTTF